MLLRHYLLAIIFFSNFTIAHQFIDGLNTSCIIRWIHDYITTPLNYSTALLVQHDAKPIYQQLYQEACTLLNISPEQQLSVKKMPRNYLFNQTMPTLIRAHTLYINEKQFREYPYGAKRFIIFHETIRGKYMETTMRSIIGWASLFATSSTMYVITQTVLTDLCKEYSRACKGGIALAGIIAHVLSTARWQQYSEHRADHEAAHATQCYQCLQEAIYMRQEEMIHNNNKTPSTRIKTSVLERIANIFKKENRLCAIHEKSDSQELLSNF